MNVMVNCLRGTQRGFADQIMRNRQKYHFFDKIPLRVCIYLPKADQFHSEETAPRISHVRLTNPNQPLSTAC